MTAHFYLFCPRCDQQRGYHRKVHHTRRYRGVFEIYRCKSCGHEQQYLKKAG